MADRKNSDAFTEAPEDKDMQDHTFGTTAAREQEEAERIARSMDGDDLPEETPRERPEPHAGGRA